MPPKHTNALARESSPYLLQHAHNPVNWEPWSEHALEKARNENKPLLISIGYSACHWCHVMEAESFEDEAVAGIMNEHFINIKIDREERPDLDQVYMDALQLMTGSGGWPLNIIALPDGKPFWGATYVRKKEWMQVLQQLAKLYKEDPAKVREYASNLSQGIQEINRIQPQEEELLDQEGIRAALYNWAEHFDVRMGGNRGAPKFMMPSNMELLLHYTHLNPDKALEDHLHTTLEKMAYGGIYDHVGGGFSRYSVDARWHVPHFEKMLYDNAQLISLYAKAYAATLNPLYEEVARQSLEFVERELSDGDGAYYSALDADSPDKAGTMKEGAFYTWQEEELQDLLGDDFPIFKDYYNVNAYGRWEEASYVLIRKDKADTLAKEHGIAVAELQARMQKCRSILLQAREQRTRPGLDNKVLTGWNAWMILALTDAYRYLGDEVYLQRALKCLSRLNTSITREAGGIFHSLGKDIPGFLEDYAPLVKACIALYETTGRVEFLEQARELTSYCQEHFLDPESGMFYFTDQQTPIVVRRSIETGDNVIPSSNAVMAENLFLLGQHFPGRGYREQVYPMLRSMQQNFAKYAHGHSHWMQVLLRLQFTFHEIAIVGADHRAVGKKFLEAYLPNCTLAMGTGDESLPLFKGRKVAAKTLIYDCVDGRCGLPSENAREVLENLRD